jgi:hypothetical protein
MTKPRDPREWDDTQVVRQLRRRIERTDVRARDLVYELELRLWSRKFEIERINKATSSLSDEVGLLGASIHEVMDRLGVPRSRPALTVVRGGDDA